MSDYNYIVYKHTNTISGKSYIGQTKQGIQKRWKDHCYIADRENSKSHNSHIARAIRKYPSYSWTHEILYYSKSYEDILLIEQYMIYEHETYTNGYNMTTGGEGCSGLTRTKDQSGSKNHMYGLLRYSTIL